MGSRGRRFSRFVFTFLPCFFALCPSFRKGRDLTRLIVRGVCWPLLLGIQLEWNESRAGCSAKIKLNTLYIILLCRIYVVVSLYKAPVDIIDSRPPPAVRLFIRHSPIQTRKTPESNQLGLHPASFSLSACISHRLRIQQQPSSSFSTSSSIHRCIVYCFWSGMCFLSFSSPPPFAPAALCSPISVPDHKNPIMTHPPLLFSPRPLPPHIAPSLLVLLQLPLLHYSALFFSLPTRPALLTPSSYSGSSSCCSVHTLTVPVYMPAGALVSWRIGFFPLSSSPSSSPSVTRIRSVNCGLVVLPRLPVVASYSLLFGRAALPPCRSGSFFVQKVLD